ncbi:MAG: hypothetical protein Kow00121_07220 [Elainellaceae cyanobacterium]
MKHSKYCLETNCLETNREDLYLPENPSTPRFKLLSTVQRWLQLTWHRLGNALTQTQELQVWQASDRTGAIQWHAYDPVTGVSVIRDSEAEMRIWIEQHYSVNLLDTPEKRYQREYQAFSLR